MGKALIIKGADFSAVAAQNIIIGGDVELAKDNATTELSAYFYNRNVAPSATPKLLFYPIKQGDYLKCPGGIITAMNVAVSLGDEVGMSDFYGDGGCVCGGLSFPGEVIIQAPADGFAVLQSVSYGGDDIFPDGCVITKEKPVTRIAGLNNYVFGANKYINAGGTWGNDTAPAEHYACLFYNVHPGEVVKVTATNGNQSIAFLQMCEDIAGRTPVFTQGVGRISVTQGTQQSITVEKEALLYVYAAGGSTLQTVEIQGV